MCNNRPLCTAPFNACSRLKRVVPGTLHSALCLEKLHSLHQGLVILHIVMGPRRSTMWSAAPARCLLLLELCMTSSGLNWCCISGLFLTAHLPASQAITTKIACCCFGRHLSLLAASLQHLQTLPHPFAGCPVCTLSS